MGTWLRRGYGLVSILVGAVGVVTCVGLIYGAWLGQAAGDAYLTDAERVTGDALTTAEARLTDALATVADARGRVQDPATVSLDRARMQQVRESVIQINNWLETLDAAVKLFSAYSFLAPGATDHEAQAPQELLQAARSGLQEFDRLADLMEQADEEGNPAGERIRQLAADVDAGLAEVESHGTELRTAVIDVRADVTARLQLSRLYLHRGTLVATLLLACLAWGQFALTIHGGRVLRGTC
jgi:hypothetical protein